MAHIAIYGGYTSYAAPTICGALGSKSTIFSCCTPPSLRTVVFGWRQDHESQACPRLPLADAEFDYQQHNTTFLSLVLLYPPAGNPLHLGFTGTITIFQNPLIDPAYLTAHIQGSHQRLGASVIG
uniref:Uncharacterized protein n=1 Tax=Psilocybe cubensis TaxID=181762 RepID=A0A8H7XMV7_PSICU